MVCGLSLLLITILLLFGLAGQTYKEDISDFLPLDNKYNKALKVYQDISGANRIFVIVQYSDSAKSDPDVIIQAVDSFVDKLRMRDKNFLFSNLTYKIDLERYSEFISFVYQNIPYFLTSNDYNRIDSILSDPNYISTQIANDKQLLMLPASSLLSENIQRDPLNLFTPVVAQLQSTNPSISYENYDGYIFTPDMQRAIIMMETPYGASETEKNGELLETLKIAARHVTAAMPDLTFQFTGGPIIAVGNANQIKSDSVLSIIIAVVLIVLLLSYVFRNVWSILMIILSIGWGWLFAMGGLALLHDSASVIVIGISSVIMGIAVNYPLHLIAHLQHTPDIKSALKEISMPLIVGNITTVGAFLALVPLQSVALRDLGLFSAMLLIGTILFVLLYLPHLLKKKQRKQTNNIIIGISDFTIDNKRWLVGSVVLLTILFAYLSFGTVFDANMNHINYMSDEQKENMTYFQQMLSSGNTNQAIYVVNKASDIDSSLNNSQSLSSTIHKLMKDGAIIDFRSCCHFLSSKAEQTNRLTQWQNLVSKHGNDIVQQTLASAKALGFQENTFDEFFDILKNNYEVKPLTYFEQLTDIAFSSNLSIDSTAHEYNVIDILYVEESNIDSIITKIEKEYPACYAFDVQSMNSSIATRLADDFNYIGWACGLIVFFFLWFSFGSLELAMMSFLPMAISWVWILGIMSALGIHFNVVNIILATFIFGQGDDYTIFMTEGCQFEYAYRRKMLSSYKSSIIVSALIMFIGIGSLIFAKHPALHSLAEVTIVGMFSVVLMAYLFPPLIYKWLVSYKGVYRQRPISLRGLFVTGYSAVVFFSQLATVYVLGGILFGLFRGKEKSRAFFRNYIRRCFWFDMNHIWGVHFHYINHGKEAFTKPAIIVCNHQSMIDTAFLMAISSKIVIVANHHASNHLATRKVFEWMQFYTIPDGESPDIKRLKELINMGYSIIIFPEGQRNSESSILRFHKGAFYIADKLALDIVPLFLHGVNNVFPRNTLCTYPGKVTIEVGRRIKHGDDDWSLDYRECTKQIHRLFEDKYSLLKRQNETAEYYLPFVLDRYRYKGAEIYGAVKRNLKFYSDYVKDVEGSNASTIVVMNSGWGELALLIALVNPSKTIVAVENDADKLQVARFSGEDVARNVIYTTSYNNVWQDNEAFKRLIIKIK